MITRLFTVPAGLIVLLLIGAAMFDREEVEKPLAPTIRPGQPSPHEARGVCTDCHLVGGPALDAPAVPALGQIATAPTIGADQIRPHGERGPCAGCHVVLPAVRAAPTFDPMTPTPAAPVALPAPGIVAPAGRPAMPGWGAGPPAAFGRAEPPAAGATPGAASIAGGLAPPIAAGAVSPHGWRGECSICHRVMQTTAWTPTPPLPATPARDLPEVEALGMAVRAATGAVPGLMVVEVEGLARRSGLQLGDVIRAVDGRVTPDLAAFRDVTRTADPGRGVVVDVVRDGQPRAVVMR